jgi:ABC-type maltose transport system permease subunit
VVAGECTMSLLRFLANWTDPRDGGRYKAIIIVAHSQGAVILPLVLLFLVSQKFLVRGIQLGAVKG